jgi:hypothetical protein
LFPFQEWLPRLVILFILVAVAFLFYASLLPERLCPGKFFLKFLSFNSNSIEQKSLCCFLKNFYSPTKFFISKTNFLMGAFYRVRWPALGPKDAVFFIELLRQ